MVVTRSRIQRIFREALILGVLVLGILAARSTLADHYYVPSGSMQNTLQIGDRVFVDKRAYGVRIPFTSVMLTSGAPVRHGDVVIFDSPRDGTRLIKRIVAVGGDVVQLRQGHLAVNGRWLAVAPESDVERIGNREVFLNLSHGGGPDLDAVVGDGMLLAVGDHRGNSADSRVFGAFSAEEVYGRAVAVYYRRGAGFGWREL